MNDGQAEIRIETSSAQQNVHRLGEELEQTTQRLSAFDRMLNATFSSTNLHQLTNFERGFNGLISAANTVSSALQIVATSIAGVMHSVITELNKLQGFQSIMAVTTSSAAAAEEQFQFLRKTANEFGIDINALTNNYSKLLAAIPEGNDRLETTQKVFTGISMAARSLHASTQDTQLMFYAVTQMASKGTVSMEELRRQLGERLPGAMEIAARAFNTTTTKLEEAIRKGIVNSAKFLDGFSDEMIRTFAGGAEKASQTVDAAINRLKNTWVDFVKYIVDSGAGKELIGIFDALREKLSDPELMGMFASMIANIAKKITEFIQSVTKDDIVNAFRAVESVLQAILTITEKIAKALIWVTDNAKTAGGAMGALFGAAKGAGIGFLFGGVPGAAIGAGVGALAGGAAGVWAGSQIQSDRTEPDYMKVAEEQQRKTAEIEQQKGIMLQSIMGALKAAQFSGADMASLLPLIEKRMQFTVDTAAAFAKVLNDPKYKTMQDKQAAMLNLAQYGIAIGGGGRKIEDTFGPGKDKELERLYKAGDAYLKNLEKRLMREEELTEELKLQSALELGHIKFRDQATYDKAIEAAKAVDIMKVKNKIEKELEGFDKWIEGQKAEMVAPENISRLPEEQKWGQNILTDFDKRAAAIIKDAGPGDLGEQTAERIKATRIEFQKLLDIAIKARGDRNLQKNMEQLQLTADQMTRSIHDETEALGLSQSELAKLTRFRQIDNEVAKLSVNTTEEQRKALKALAELLKGEVSEALDQYNAKRKDASVGLSKAYKDWSESVANDSDWAANAFTTAVNKMGDAFMNFVKTGKLSFTDLMNYIVDTITRRAIDKLLDKYVIGPLMDIWGLGDKKKSGGDQKEGEKKALQPKDIFETMISGMDKVWADIKKKASDLFDGIDLKGWFAKLTDGVKVPEVDFSTITDALNKLDIPELDFSTITDALDKLDIPSLDFSNLKDLANIDIPDLDFSKLSDALNIDIPELDFSKITDALNKVDIPELDFSTITDALDKFDIPELDFSSLKDLANIDIPDLDFSSLKDLANIDIPDLDFSKITDALDSIDIPDLDFSSLQDLSDLDFSKLIDGLDNIDIPDLDFSKLTDSLDNIEIPDLDFSNLLDLSKIEVPDLDFDNLRSLADIDIPDLDFSNLVDLSNIQIPELDFSNLTDALDFKVPDVDFTSLQEFADLDFSPITEFFDSFDPASLFDDINLQESFSNLFEGIDLQSLFSELFSKLDFDKISSLLDGLDFGGIFDKIKSFDFGSLFSGFGSGGASAASSGGGFEELLTTIGSFFGFANGGYAPANQMRLVGERGPELEVPRNSSYIIPNEVLSKIGGQQYAINVTVQGDMGKNPTEVGNRVGGAIAYRLNRDDRRMN